MSAASSCARLAACSARQVRLGLGARDRHHQVQVSHDFGEHDQRYIGQWHWCAADAARSGRGAVAARAVMAAVQEADLADKDVTHTEVAVEVAAQGRDEAATDNTGRLVVVVLAVGEPAPSGQQLTRHPAVDRLTGEPPRHVARLAFRGSEHIQLTERLLDRLAEPPPHNLFLPVGEQPPLMQFDQGGRR